MHRKAGLRVADLAYALAGEEIGRVRCDGLVVATPQGSTGYNLANGGPVLAWGVEGYVVSFIAPHSLTARALVVAPTDELTINNASREEPVEVHVDGRRRSSCRRARTSTSRSGSPTARSPSSRARLLPPPARALRPAGALGGLAAVLAGGASQCSARNGIVRGAECGESATAFACRGTEPLGPRLAPRPRTLSACTLATNAELAARPSGPPGRPPFVLHELRVENLLLIERAELLPRARA